MGILTLSWEDLYDYYRCLKIIAFKTAKLKTRALPSYASESLSYSKEVRDLGEFLVKDILPKIMEGEQIRIEDVKNLLNKY
jgi:hypothetical protein